MNYLAHIYLSGDDEMIRIGNFMADHVKGSKYKVYPPEVQKGILLHRRIDWFTDQDEIVRKSKRRLHDRYGLYRGVVIDIFYDHMLAAHWSHYSDELLPDYAREFYDSVESNLQLLPEQVRYLSGYMIRNDWLSSYAHPEGIRKVLDGMNRRTQGKGKIDLAINDLLSNYGAFEEDFRHFFKKLRTFSAQNLKEIHAQYSNQ
jgi:acyl carrier protein phosphodiesterase